MNNTETSSWCETTPKDRANGQRVMRWSLAWAAMMLSASAASSFNWFDGRIAGLVGAVLSAILGVFTVRAYRYFLKETDELRQKIELEALGIALGVGVVGGTAYMQVANSLDKGEPRLSIVIAGMLVTYSITVGIGRRRYA